MKILAGSALTGGDLAYRIVFPLHCLQARGCDVSLVQTGVNATVFHSGMFYGKDIVLLQKVTNPTWYDMLGTVPREHRPMAVYEIDDLLWAMDHSNPSYMAWQKNKAGMLSCIARADAVICSTEPLKREVLQVFPRHRVEVVPNYIDLGRRNWDAEEPRPGGINIGWAGGSHHYGDEEGHFAAAIRDILAANGEVNFLFAGDPKLFGYWNRSIKAARPSQVQYIGCRSFDECPGLISQFDIGLAPLKQSRFNACKSDLKLLEYGAYGIPYVATDIAPYRAYDSAAQFGFLADSYKGWMRDLQYLIDNQEDREMMGAEHSAYVREQRGPEQCGQRWLDTLCRLKGYNEQPRQ